jgi:hypothetical protein
MPSPPSCPSTWEVSPRQTDFLLAGKITTAEALELGERAL